MIIRPNGSPATKNVVPLTRVDVKTVIEFERWCEAMGLALDLYCKKCVDAYAGSNQGGRCWANNSRDANVWHMECHCTDRVYGNPSAEDRSAPARSYEPKIQVMVP